MSPIGFQVQRGHLPPQLTAFVGRENEIAQVMEILANSRCRLLTLVGEGGIGKSRLAVEIAAQSQGYYPDGIHFVDLQTVHTSDRFLQVIAETLNYSLSGQRTAFEQLLHLLREKDMLLVLDNFEQLLPVRANELVSDLVNGCPDLTLLVTSREVLNLRQEWVWRVPGLAFPPEDTVKPLEQYDAVRLFTERARHIRSDFLIENELPHVLEICRLVEGMPLALELAACWLKVLPCKAIAQEIRHNLDFLNSHQRDLPERHRSIRAVLEHGWKLLSPSERETINHLSIFKGGFRREAAEQVAGASLGTLLLLTDKSLLRLEANGRFHIHELVRQYAAEQLGEVDALLDAHCAYYAGFLHRRNTDLYGGRQVSASDEIAEELDNIRAAWAWAVKQSNVEALRRMVEAYALFCQFRGRYQEAYEVSYRASRHLMSLETSREIDQTLGYLLSLLGWMYIRLGQPDKAEESFRQCESVFKRLDTSPSVGYALDPSIGRAVAALVRGDYGEAERLAEQARQRAEISRSPSNMSVACRTLAEAYLRQGSHDNAQQYAWRAYQVCEEANDRWFMAYCLTTLGEVALEAQANAAAKRHFEAAYALRQEFHDPEGMALVLAYLGDIAFQQQSLAEALHYYDESRALYQQINDPGGLARTLCGLSRAHLSLQDYPPASETCRKALQIAVTIHYIPVLLQLLITASELCYVVRSKARGLEILALVTKHAAANHATRTIAQQFLARHHIAQLPPPPTGYDLHNIASLLQMAEDIGWVLLEIEKTQDVENPHDSLPTGTDSEPSSDTLSQRELEVLSHIAAGLQNREIADRLVVSLNTIKTHINNIYSKLGVTNRVQAVTRARELGVI